MVSASIFSCLVLSVAHLIEAEYSCMHNGKTSLGTSGKFGITVEPINHPVPIIGSEVIAKLVHPHVESTRECPMKIHCLKAKDESKKTFCGPFGTNNNNNNKPVNPSKKIWFIPCENNCGDNKISCVNCEQNHNLQPQPCSCQPTIVKPASQPISPTPISQPSCFTPICCQPRCQGTTTCCPMTSPQIPCSQPTLVQPANHLSNSLPLTIQPSSFQLSFNPTPCQMATPQPVPSKNCQTFCCQPTSFQFTCQQPTLSNQVQHQKTIIQPTCCQQTNQIHLPSVCPNNVCFSNNCNRLCSTNIWNNNCKCC